MLIFSLVNNQKAMLLLNLYHQEENLQEQNQTVNAKNGL